MIRFWSFFTLCENRIDFLKKTVKDVDHDTIDHFASHDPTPKKIYTQWMVNQHRRGDLPKEHAEKAGNILSQFDQHKGKMKESDINKYDHISHVEKALSPYEGTVTGKQEKRRVKNDGSEIVHDEDGIVVRKIKTVQAACAYGKGTKWCTASDEDNKFDDFNKDGPLHIIHTPDNRKYQLHVASNQLKDEKDDDVDFHDLVDKHPNLKKIVGVFADSKNIDDQAMAARFSLDHAKQVMKKGGDIHPNIRREIATHPELAKNFMDDPDPNVRREVASHRQYAERYLNDPDAVVRFHVAGHSDLAHHLVGDPDWLVRTAVANQNKTLAKSLINDPDHHVRAAVATHYPEEMIHDPEELVRQHIAYRYPKEYGHILVHDRSHRVRSVLAAHKEFAGHLLNDSDHWTRHRAHQTLGLVQKTG